jgi:hypothetical protein
MKAIKLMILFVVLSAPGFAQVDTTPTNTDTTRVSTVPDGVGPMYILKGDGRVAYINGAIKQETKEALDAIKPEWVDEIEVLKGQKATDHIGKAGENGVIIIKLKKGMLRHLPDKLKKEFH